MRPGSYGTRDRLVWPPSATVATRSPQICPRSVALGGWVGAVVREIAERPRCQRPPLAVGSRRLVRSPGETKSLLQTVTVPCSHRRRLAGSTVAA